MGADVLSVLRKPIITEKSTTLGEQGKYVFEVAPWANKTRVREAVELAFDVKVRAVRILRLKGALRRVGAARRLTRSRLIKKAVVTLRQGDTIQLFEGA